MPVLNVQVLGVTDSLIESLGPDHIRIAASRALGRSVQSAKSKASELIRIEYNIRKSDLDPKFTTRTASVDNLQATLILFGEPISMTYFNPVQISGNVQTFFSKNRGVAQKQIKRPRFQGVRVEIIKSKPTTIQNRFIATMPTGYTGVFRRKGKTAYPILVQKVITYPSMLSKPENVQALISAINDAWTQQFNNQIKQAEGRQ